MIHKYKEFNDWYYEPIDGLTSVRSDYLPGQEDEYHAAWDAARMIDEDPITLELLAALEALLEDTQHSKHNCDDSTCPVKTAREALAKHRKAGE